MLKRLRFKFVCTNMVIVTIMLCVIFALVLNFTRANLEEQSIQMMQSIAANLRQMGRPGENPGQIQLPYFALQIGPKGEVNVSGGSFYDLSDQDLLLQMLEASLESNEQTGILSEYNLRYYRMDTPVSQHIVFADISIEISTMNSQVQEGIRAKVSESRIRQVVDLSIADTIVKAHKGKIWAESKDGINTFFVQLPVL